MAGRALYHCRYKRDSRRNRRGGRKQFYIAAAHVPGGANRAARAPAAAHADERRADDGTAPPQCEGNAQILFRGPQRGRGKAAGQVYGRNGRKRADDGLPPVPPGRQGNELPDFCRDYEGKEWGGYIFFIIGLIALMSTVVQYLAG